MHFWRNIFSIGPILVVVSGFIGIAWWEDIRRENLVWRLPGDILSIVLSCPDASVYLVFREMDHFLWQEGNTDLAIFSYVFVQNSELWHSLGGIHIEMEHLDHLVSFINDIHDIGINIIMHHH